MSIPPFGMAREIANYEAISQLKKIEDVSIDEIEKRARPGQWSISGFLGASENFKEVLQQDWRTVKALGTMHIELASHLRTIWTQAEQTLEQIPSADPVNFRYCVNQYNNHVLQECDGPSQHWDRVSRKLAFAIGIIMGLGAILAAIAISSLSLLTLLPAGACIAYAYRKGNVDGGQSFVGQLKDSTRQQLDIFAQNKDEAYRKGWSRRLTLTNSFNNVSITIGEGVMNYIEWYGFYEGGGEQNPYRIDPLKLVAMLTGESIEALRARIKPPQSVQ